MSTILKKHIFGLIVTLLIALGSIAGIVFFLSKINTKMARTIEVKQRIALYEKNKKSFADGSDKLRSLEKNLNILESKIITEETVPELLSHLERLAEESGAGLDITGVQTPVIEEKPTLVIDFSTKGSYLQIQNFLAVLQHQSFQVNISRLYLIAEQAESTQQATSGTLSVTSTKPAQITKEKLWQAVVTIEIISF